MVRNERAKKTIFKNQQLINRASNCGRSWVLARKNFSISLVFMLRCRSIDLILNNFSPGQLETADLSCNYRRCLSHVRSFLTCRDDIKSLTIRLQPLISVEQGRTDWRAMERTCEAVLGHLKRRRNVGRIRGVWHLGLACQGSCRYGSDTSAGDEEPLSLTKTRLEEIARWCALEDFLL